MKLATDLPLRKDDTVTAAVPGAPGERATVYTFKAGASGQITADVDNEEHVGYLLDTGNFYPADEKDIGAGVAAVKLNADGAGEATDAATESKAEPQAKAAPKAKQKAAAGK